MKKMSFDKDGGPEIIGIQLATLLSEVGDNLHVRRLGNYILLDVGDMETDSVSYSIVIERIDP